MIDYQQNGNQHSLATLYFRYSDMIYGTCLKYLKDAEKARDAVVYIYEELLDKLPKYEVENFKSWLYVLVKNYCLAQLRRNKHAIMVDFETQLLPSDDFSQLDEIHKKEAAFKTLENCMQHLPTEQLTMIKLFYYENKCYNEIAALTGLEWSKVRSAIQNGRRNLKICMEKNGKH